MINRGRPKKRPAGSLARKASKRTLEKERKAHEHLPTGVKACDVKTFYGDEDLEALRRQAIGQASRFEVLRPKDVDDLSRVSYIVDFTSGDLLTNLGTSST